MAQGLMQQFMYDDPAPSAASADLPYSNYGYHPGYAQALQENVVPDRHLSPQPYFNTEQLAHANWFTTRVHLAPIGKVNP